MKISDSSQRSRRILYLALPGYPPSLKNKDRIAYSRKFSGKPISQNTNVKQPFACMIIPECGISWEPSLGKHKGTQIKQISNSTVTLKSKDKYIGTIYMLIF